MLLKLELQESWKVLGSMVCSKRRKGRRLSITTERLATPMQSIDTISQESTSWHIALLINCHTPLVIRVKDTKVKIEHLPFFMLIPYLAYWNIYLKLSYSWDVKNQHDIVFCSGYCVAQTVFWLKCLLIDKFPPVSIGYRTNRPTVIFTVP